MNFKHIRDTVCVSKGNSINRKVQAQINQSQAGKGWLLKTVQMSQTGNYDRCFFFLFLPSSTSQMSQHSSCGQAKTPHNILVMWFPANMVHSTPAILFVTPAVWSQTPVIYQYGRMAVWGQIKLDITHTHTHLMLWGKTLFFNPLYNI